MVGIQKAPILHHFSESVAGAATIRCFNQETRFSKKNLHLVDDYSRVVFYNSSTMEWLCLRINFLFNLVFFILLVILVTIPRSAIDPSKYFLPYCFFYDMLLQLAYSVPMSHMKHHQLHWSRFNQPYLYLKQGIKERL